MKIKRSELKSLIENYMLMEITPGVMGDPTTGSAAAGYIGGELDLEDFSSFAPVASKALKDYLDGDPDILKDANKLSLEALNMYFDMSSKLGLFSLIPDLIIELGLAAIGGPVAAGIGAGILMLGPVIVPPVLEIMSTNEPIKAGEIMFQLVQDAIDNGFIDIADIRSLLKSKKGSLLEQRIGDDNSGGASTGWFGTEKCFIDAQFPEGHPQREICDSMGVSELIIEAGFIPVLSIVLFFAAIGGICLYLSTKGGPDPIKCGKGVIDFIKWTFSKLKDFLKPFFEKCRPLFDKAKALFKKGDNAASSSLDNAASASLDDVLLDATEFDSYISSIKGLSSNVSTSNTVEQIQKNLDDVSTVIADLRQSQLAGIADDRIEDSLRIAAQAKEELTNIMIMKTR